MKFVYSFLLLTASTFAAPITTPLEAGQIIPGKYIITFNENAVSSKGSRFFSHTQQLSLLNQVASNSQSTVTSKLQIGRFKAFVVEGDSKFEDGMKEHGDVATVYPNRVILTQEQANAPWGLTRVSHRNMTNDRTYDYIEKCGEGVDVYVIDTGIDVEHPEFEGRASWGASFVESNATVDGMGHGTHVAGTIGSKSYGVAKSVKIIAVRVLGSDGSGDTIGVISGMQWTAESAQKSKRKSVANMSLGGPKDVLIDAAAKELIKVGVHLVVAAGNSNTDACNSSPAREPSVLTVGATDSKDLRATFSNQGKCVDIFAPGVDILSTWLNGQTNTISGTSMASPHVAGVLAVILSVQDFPSVDDAFTFIRSISTVNRLKGIKGAFNGIAYVGKDLSIEDTPLPPPSVKVCSVLTCWFRAECDECRGLVDQ